MYLIGLSHCSGNSSRQLHIEYCNSEKSGERSRALSLATTQNEAIILDEQQSEHLHNPISCSLQQNLMAENELFAGSKLKVKGYIFRAWSNIPPFLSGIGLL